MTTRALQRDRLRPPSDDFPELLAYFERSFPDDHPFARLADALPGSPEVPEVWLLGSSEQSAIWAGEEGLRASVSSSSTPGRGTRQDRPRPCLGWGAVKRVRRVHLVAATGLVAAFALGATLPAAFGNGDDEPDVVRNALAQTGKVQGAPKRELILSKVVVDPGAKLALHRHRGTQVARIVSGVLNYTVERGQVVVRRGESDQNPTKARTIKAGQTARLRPGEWLVEQPSDIHRAANRGRERVVIFLSTLLEAGAPPATPVSLP